MMYQLFSAAGCVRCSVVKAYMDANGVPYREQDIKADGKDAFKSFYKQNRKAVVRGTDGIEFPILYTGERIYQGLGVALAFLIAGDRLESAVRRSDLCRGWVGGIGVYDRPDTDDDALMALLRFIKAQGLKVEIETDGTNPDLLAAIIQAGLLDRLSFLLRGPAGLYEQITGVRLTESKLAQSLNLLSPPVSYKIILTMEPFQRDGERSAGLTPEEAADAARFVFEATGSKTHPFYIGPAPDLPDAEPASIDRPNLFKYRTMCRPYQVKCEILKN